jgi:hypothetical protein
LDDYRAGFFWGARKESLEACSQRVLATLEALHELDPVFDHWSEPMGEDAREIALEAEAIGRALSAGVNRGDVSGEPIPELGYTLLVCSGGRLAGQVSFKVMCGAYSKWNRNVCLVRLPRASTDAGARLLDRGQAVRLCEILVNCWDPDHGVVSSHGIDDALEIDEVPGTGWMTYRSVRLGSIAQVDPPGTVVPIGGLGWIIIAMDQVPHAEDPTHLRNIQRVRDVLRRG